MTEDHEGRNLPRNVGLQPPDYYFWGRVPVRLLPTSDGGLAVERLDLRSGEFVKDPTMLAEIFFNPSSSTEVERVAEAVFLRKVEEIRSRLRCCSAPDWRTAVGEFARLYASDVDLERCRGCGSWRLTTYWPKDSADRTAMNSTIISDSDADALQAADWTRRREMLESKGWYGLE